MSDKFAAIAPNPHTRAIRFAAVRQPRIVLLTCPAEGMLMVSALATQVVLATMLAPPQGGYLVLVEPGADDAYLPAARALAELRDGEVLTCDVDDTEALLATLGERQPRYVAYVMPPDRIDVQVAHRLLEVATNVDDDPFVDFEYAFITGRDGTAASRFVERIKTAQQREYGSRAGFFGSWEGMPIPKIDRGGGAAKALGLDMDVHLIGVKELEQWRAEKARAAFVDFATRDVLLFFSHGYPDQMVSCFKAPDLREWKVDLNGAILINCACYNGAPGRWWEPNFATGEYVDRGVINPDKSVALAVIDSGVAGYFGGIDPWHGPLANQVFLLVVDDGMRLGEASKRMADRLALAFSPERVHYPPMTERHFAGEGHDNRLSNGAGMIVYGDPAFAPFKDKAAHLLTTGTEEIDESTLRCTIAMKPLRDGAVNQLDGMLPQARLMDYYSVQTPDVLNELKMEVHRVFILPESWQDVESVEVESLTTSRDHRDVPRGQCQWAVERTLDGPLLHVRIPIDATLFRSTWQIFITTYGLDAVVKVTRNQ